jgi:hypothetical protein
MALADSAGVPWEGRHFEQNVHAADDGSAPPALIEALGKFHDGSADASVVVDAFRDSRLLIPLVAHLGEAGENEHGQLIDKSQELSIVTVAGPDGRNVMPVFSSVTAMGRWNPDARPVPADGIRVALAAAHEQTDLVVLDPLSDTQFVLRRPALWAIAQSQPWLPSHLNPDVAAAMTASINEEAAIIGVQLASGDPAATLAGPELTVRLTLVGGLAKPALDATLSRLASRWAADEVIATKVDSLAVQLVASAHD